jgi:hypothetical protein
MTILATAVLLTASPTAAQVFDARCDAALAGHAPVFESAGHRNWYRRFWTGECSGQLLCQPGSPNWREVIARAEAEGSSTTLTSACRLGRRLGHEWSRSKSVRRIDTGDLRRFNRLLESSASFPAGLAEVSRQVDAALARP